MREILKLMFPIHFRGNIYHKAAMIICLPFLIAVGGLSIWSNQHGVESVFASLPAYVLKASTYAVVLIDPVAWLCFTLLIVSVYSFTVIERLEKVESMPIPEELSKGLKPKLIASIFIFLSLTIGLTYLTFKLSDKGGKKGAGEFIDTVYKPTVGLDSIMQQHKQVLNAEVSTLKGAYADRVSAYKVLISDANAAYAANENWNKNKEYPNWNKFNKMEKANLDKEQYQVELKELYTIIEEKEAAITARNKNILDAQSDAYAEEAGTYAAKQADADSAMFYAVRSWTILGLIIQLVSFVLTSDLYKATAYAFIRQELQAHNKQQRSIEKELLIISANSQTEQQPIPIIKQVHKQKEQPLMQEAEPVKQIEKEVETIIEEAPRQASKEDELVEQYRRRFSAEWLRTWKFALTDKALNELSKSKAAAKFECSVSTIDNMRRTHKIMRSGVDSDSQLKAILENI